MALEVIPIGGYEESGKNMTVIKYGDEAVILDMGFHLPSLVGFEEQGGNRRHLTTRGLQKLGAIPDDSKVLNNLKNWVKAIVPSHCHLDHIGAIPYLEGGYNAPIISTPYTTEVLKILAADEKIKLKNEVFSKKAGSRFRVSKNIEVELLNMTHSTLDCASVIVHTPEGKVVYINDFKLDNKPIIGKKPDYNRLKELGKGGDVRLLILNCLYAHAHMKTPSESVAKEMLKDVMLGAENHGNSLIVTCFASHIARLKSAVEFGRKLNRKVVFLGRSLSKYTQAADNLNYVPWMKDVEVLTYSRQVEKKLHQIEKKRDKHLIVCTGNQAEPGAILTRIGESKLPFKFLHDDHVVFSCKTIPVEPNITNREKLEKQLRTKGVRLFKDIHVSGHGAREDHRDIIDMVKPEKLIPVHAPRERLEHITDLTELLGYKTGKDVLFMKNGKKIVLK